jgi:putative protease
MDFREIEIMSPVGSFESLMAAVQGGAGSVYYGIGKLNMRARSSNNFTEDDLVNITEIASKHSIKTYLTLNTIIYDEDLEMMKQVADAAKKNEVSAIIASDMAVIEYVNSIGMEVHISTQCNVTNIEAVKYYSRFADVIVTARELSLKQIAFITKQISEQQIKGPSGKLVRIEVFVHGALCMAISGRCYLSNDLMNHSANRGDCLQLCRRSYIAADKEEGYELEIDNHYILSPKDLCSIGFIDKIIEAGVTVFKIEGRGRSADYVKTVTQCYSEAVKAIREKNYTAEAIACWTEKLKTVYNRGFWDGYYLGKKTGEWTESYGSQASKTKLYVGKVTNYYTKLGIAEIKMETHEMQIGDELLIIGPTTGVLEMNVSEIRVDLKNTEKAVKGETCSIPVKGMVRKNDKIYKLLDNI